MKKRLSVLALILALVMVLTACGTKPSTDPGTEGTEGAKPITIVCGSMGNPDTTYIGQADLYFVDRVAELSDGAITIDMKNKSVLGYEAELIQQCMDGTVPFVVVGPSILSNYTDYLDAIMLPFLIDDIDLEYQVFHTDEFKALCDAVSEECGVKIIGTGENGLRHFVTTTGPINSISDLKGLKIRVTQSETLIKAMETIGANPIPLAYNELYSGLQNKVIEAEEINLMSVKNQRHYEVAKYMSMIGMYPYASLYVFNLDYWNGLTEEQQEILLQAGSDVTDKIFKELLPLEEESARKIASDGGMQFNDVANRQEFYDAMSPLWEEYAEKDPLIKAFIDKVLELKFAE